MAPCAWPIYTLSLINDDIVTQYFDTLKLAYHRSNHCLYFLYMYKCWYISVLTSEFYFHITMAQSYLICAYFHLKDSMYNTHKPLQTILGY